jgi:hypothetical protein
MQFKFEINDIVAIRSTKFLERFGKKYVGKIAQISGQCEAFGEPAYQTTLSFKSNRFTKSPVIFMESELQLVAEVDRS